MLPEGWKTTQLRSLVASLDGGVSVNGEDRTREAGDKGVLRVSSVSNGVFQPNEHKVIVESELVLAKTSPKADRIIISRSNTGALVGASAYVEEDYPELFLSDKLWQVEPALEKQTSMRWLAYWLASDSTRTYLSRLGTGSSGSMKNISKDELLSLHISVPPFNEQSRMAEILATWDAAITTTGKLLANSRNYWLALTCELLMPVPISTERQAGSFPPSVQAGIPKLPPTPKGWRKVALGAHLHEINRPVNLEPDTEYTLVTVRRSRGGVDKRSVLFGSQIKTPSQFFVAAGDFLISKRQIVHGACGIVPAELDGAVVSNEYAVLGSDGEIDPRFLRYLSETTYFQQTCFHSSIGVHVEKMLFRTEQWLKRPFNIPPLDEQRRIVEILDAARQQIALEEQQLALLKAEKRALMQQLLTGKRRVRLA